MATFSTALLVALFGLHVHAGASHQQPIVRRQEEDTIVHLDSSGEMMRARHGVEQSALMRSAVSPHSKGVDDSANFLRTDSDDNDLCDDDFPLGKEDSNNCSIPANHSLILQEKMCIEAAKEAGATVHEATFMVPQEQGWQDKRPKGCFMAKCGYGTGICYFYNPIGDFPTAPKGTPVCSRPKFLKGKANTNGLDTDCPDGYAVMMGEKECRQTAGCLGHGFGEPFLKAVHNNSRHEEFPEGCFIDAADHKAYFNPALKGFGKPKHPVGTPICNVSAIVKCSKDGCKPVDPKVAVASSAVASGTKAKDKQDEKKEDAKTAADGKKTEKKAEKKDEKTKVATTAAATTAAPTTAAGTSTVAPTTAAATTAVPASTAAAATTTPR